MPLPGRWRVLAATLLIVFLSSIAAVAMSSGVHWDYYSHGGAAGWGSLTEEGSEQLAFPDCNLLEQSPVNIAGAHRQRNGLTLNYQPTRLDIVNNGHTIQVNYEAGSSLTVGDRSYDLLQFHFHAPSEHQFGGAPAALEAHFVHRAADGEFAVLGILITEGTPNPAFQAVIDAMPAQEGRSTANRVIDPAALLPTSLDYYAYDGSFTTPPCTEGVKWLVLVATVEVSTAQADAFRALEFLHHDEEFRGNARPVQPLNGRLGDRAAPMAEAGAITPPSTGDGGLRHASRVIAAPAFR